ncbi:hypothetical protein Prudu_022351 [Prunus dulcis]|uniref:Uncharacterized protein n=1 Tax=Prunus dulcis TaxID=3755 RepID=A0A4Y1RZH4_PRUDU|nr:hypothetical protein Prudu_022351 [Prunus dulcis]
MEEETKCVQIDGEEGGDEFYEKIEAPKFVDFTEPDPYRPDDRYWFCMRVGCDQKHEEELDSEAVYKNFVLRVMAARSPNVRHRKTPSLKCPLTAPAKSSKPRVSRLALISSFSRKMVDVKDKARPLQKISATPNVKAKQPSSVAKALTSPRNRKPISNPDTFRSVRNPKLKNVAVPKNRVVAKALVFHSPKKAVRTKVSKEWGSPVGKMCSAMKKLEITSGKKHVLGYNKPLPLDTSRKQFRGREVKSRVFDSLHSNNCKGQEAKSMKRKNKETDLKQCCDTVTHEGINDNDSADMEVDEKSRNGTLEGFSLSGTAKSGGVNGDEQCTGTGKTSEPPLGENQVEVLSVTSKGDPTSLSSSKHGDSEENDDKENAKDGNGHVEKIKSSSEKANTVENMDKDDDKENSLASNNPENENEVFESDDKENNKASDENRDLNTNGHSKRKNLGKHGPYKNSQKVNQAQEMKKESSTSAATNAQGMKNRKPKSTNPKPFRFRTDERGMLKEATLEKKVHAPLEEITLVKLPGAKPINKQKVVQMTKNCLGQSDNENDTQGGSEKRFDRRTQLDENGKKGAKKTSKRNFERNLSLITPQNEPGLDRIQKPDKERTKSPMVQKKFCETQRGRFNWEEGIGFPQDTLSTQCNKGNLVDKYKTQESSKPLQCFSSNQLHPFQDKGNTPGTETYAPGAIRKLSDSQNVGTNHLYL